MAQFAIPSNRTGLAQILRLRALLPSPLYHVDVLDTHKGCQEHYLRSGCPTRGSQCCKTLLSRAHLAVACRVVHQLPHLNGVPRLTWCFPVPPSVFAGWFYGESLSIEAYEGRTVDSRQASLKPAQLFLSALFGAHRHEPAMSWRTVICLTYASEYPPASVLGGRTEAALPCGVWAGWPSVGELAQLPRSNYVGRAQSN
jgi:hypothetical protein